MSESKKRTGAPTHKSSSRAEWERTTLKNATDRVPDRDGDFSTVSSMSIERLYTREDLGPDWDES